VSSCKGKDMSKPFSFILAILVLISVAGCQKGQDNFPVLKGPYLGQEPPGMQPEIFAPGIVSDPSLFEYAGTFSPDGNEYYFWRLYDDSPSKFLCSKLVDGKWTAPEQLAVVAEYQAGEPHITFDNKRLYFIWQHPVPPGQYGIPQYYFVERTPNGWSEPEYAGQGMFLSSSRDGQLYTTDMSSRNINGNTYLAKVTTDNGLFVNYERLAIQPQLGFQAHPCISPDGSYILFDVEGGSYLFISFKNPDGTWGDAIDLTKHGFDPLAGGAYISPDGKYLFFALNEDIWWVDVKVIENLKPK
jgi:Tol biopolymer transport system component